MVVIISDTQDLIFLLLISIFDLGRANRLQWIRCNDEKGKWSCGSEDDDE